ncbi:MAG: hypothetical protein KJT03_05670 [Verrucomicrobiae bacterium]|nr:hypothetical protein [Verrucomicrobiae bacterium]
MAGRIANLILLGLSLSPFLSFGQEEEPTRSLSFWAYRVGNGNWSGIRFEARNGEVDTLSLGKFMKGRVHEYEGPARLVFFREVPSPTPTEPDRIVRDPVAQTMLPAGLEEAILVFTSTKSETEDEFRINVIDGGDGFPANTIRVFNATGVRLAGKVGRENTYFDPGPSEPFSLEPFLERGIPVAFLVETREGPKFVFEKDLEYAEDRRVILLLEPPRRKGSYKIQATNLIERVE